MKERIMAWGLAFTLVLANLFVVFVFMPSLVNMHNDGALILGAFLPFVVGVIDYLFVIYVLPLMAGGNKE